MSKNAEYDFQGMMPILPTAVTQDGSIDVNSERKLIDYCIKCGAVAIGHLALASEFKKLSQDDRDIVTDVLIEQTAGQTPVFIGVTAPSRRTAVHYAKCAQSKGADLIMAALPFAEVPDTQEAYDYYKAISESVSIPIIIQDIPMSQPVLTVDLMWQMYCDFENVSFIKAEDNHFLYKTSKLLKLSQDGSELIGGYGGKHLIHMLEMGVKAFMTGTEALDIHNKVVTTFLAGQTQNAKHIYINRILPYLEFYSQYSEQLLKEMLFWRGIIDCEKVISPRNQPPVSEPELKIFKKALDDIDYYNIEYVKNNI